MAFLAPAPVRALPSARARRARRPNPPSCCTPHPPPPPTPPTPPTPSSPLSLDAFLARLRTLDASAPTPPSPTAPAAVHLVGTGPGDPSLLTLRALWLMQRADVVLYDRLVSPAILSLVRPGATLVYVGKAPGFHTRPQDDIHRLLRAFAQPGNRVLRLKGGDPFVFGRGGEETDFLDAHGVHVHAVPGITAAAGIAAALGIPLTHRGIASSVRFLTGHLRQGATLSVGHVDEDTTLVVYMGLAQLPVLVRDFVAAGLAADTPAVAVERGTTPEQRVVVAPLDGLHAKVEAAALKSPTLIIIGNVVKLGRCWKVEFEQQDVRHGAVPPRAVEDDEGLVALMEEIASLQ